MTLPNSLHARLGLFSLALFLAVQIPTLVLAYRGNNEVVTEWLSADLDHGTRTFRRVLDERGVQLALATRVLASDFAFRKALALAEPATIQSVLENHSARLRADFGVVLSPARSVVAATGTATRASAQVLANVAPEAEESAGRSFILPLDHRLLQIAVVPVLAPDPVGWAGFGWELDQRAANDLKQLVDLEISFLTVSDGNKMMVSASTLPAALHETIRQQFAAVGLANNPVRTVEMGGDVVGFEALVRWNHPQRGLIMPDAFIGIAEQTGAVREVTRYVVTETVHQLLRWSQKGMKLAIAVNISARDLQDDSFPSFVAERLTESGLDASLLRFEITERALLDNLDAAAQTLRALQYIGIRVSLDDYGTGYATLTHISQLPVSEIKIDRSFVTHLTNDTRNFAIVLSTVQMGHRLGMTVVAEGVETMAELNAVRECGCDEVQGCYFAKPMAAGLVQDWLRERDTRA